MKLAWRTFYPPTCLSSLAFTLAEASCAFAIRTAKDFVADVGEAAASNAGGIVELSRKGEETSERDCHQLMSKKFRLSLPLTIHYLKAGTDSKPVKIAFLRFRDWMAFLLENNLQHLLVGLVKPNHQREGDILEAFWSKFRVQCPHHPIFQKAAQNQVVLRRCTPLLLHGDEGRGQKRLPFLVLNLHSPLGRGVNVEGAPKRCYLKMLPNFIGHSYTTRFLVSAVPKCEYTGKNKDAFDVLMQATADELAYMASAGVEHRGQTHWAIVLGIVGD